MSQVTCMLVLCWFLPAVVLAEYGHGVVRHRVELILQDSLPGLIHVYSYALGFCLLLRNMAMHYMLVAQSYIYPL
jgi:hypothetical protein